MKGPDNHSLFYELILFSVVLAGLILIQKWAENLSKTLTPDVLRIGVTSLVFAFSAVVLFDLWRSRQERKVFEMELDSRLGSIELSARELSENVKELIDMATKTGPIKGFLVSARTLLKEESAISAGEVWIYTPELSVDMTENFSAMIAGNIKRGIRYRYFLPDVPDRHGDLNILKANISNLTDHFIDQVPECLSVVWLPAALSRPGGMTIHVHEGAPRILAGFTTIPYEKWGNDFFIRMDDIYSARALHYLHQLKEEHSVRRG